MLANMHASHRSSTQKATALACGNHESMKSDRRWLLKLKRESGLMLSGRMKRKASLGCGVVLLLFSSCFRSSIWEGLLAAHMSASSSESRKPRGSLARD